MSAKIHGDKFVGIMNRICKPSMSIDRALYIVKVSLNHFKWEIESDRKNGVYTTDEYHKRIKEIDTSFELLKEKVL